MRLFISNSPFATTETDLRDLLADYGEATGIRIMSDRDTGRSRGFGFADIEDGGGERAIAALDGIDYGGRTLKVNEARPMPARDGGGIGKRFSGGAARSQTRGRGRDGEPANW